MAGPIRSMLYAPGNKPRLVSKVATFGSDAIILDLEDAVPIAEKVATRDAVRAALPTLQPGPLRYVRVNSLDTGWTFADLDAVVCADLDGIKLPKVESPRDLELVDLHLRRLERDRGLPEGRIDLAPIIETARGVLNAREIAASGTRVRKLGFGAGDYCRDVGTRFSGNLWEADGLELISARTQVVLASRAAGLDPPIDTVWLDIRDNEGLERDATVALRLGFQGKSAIYPGQIEVIHRVFSPSAADIDYARRVDAAFAEAEAAGSASIQVDGRLVDYPIAIKARWLLERARGFGLC
ncbi:MAG: CoA ester lyase [Chloroflexota bacterium]